MGTEYLTHGPVKKKTDHPVISVLVIFRAENHIGPVAQYHIPDILIHIVEGVFPTLTEWRMGIGAIGGGETRRGCEHHVTGTKIHALPILGHTTVAVAKEDKVRFRNTAAGHALYGLGIAALGVNAHVAVGHIDHVDLAATAQILLKDTAEKIELIILMGHDDHDAPVGKDHVLAIVHVFIDAAAAENIP